MAEVEDVRKTEAGIKQSDERPSFQKLLSSEKLSSEEIVALTSNAEERVALLEKTLEPTAEHTESDAPDYNRVSQLVESVKQGAPQELENYLATRYIGEGGLFYVLQGHSKNLDESRPVALKIPKQQKHFSALQRHKETLLRLKHPNIPDIIDARSDGKVPFVAEQFIDGETLADIIAKNKAEKKYLSEETVLDVANQLLSTLAHIHEQGVTHKDIKPHNVIMKEGKVYITDFNIADIVEEDSDKAKNTLVTASTTKFEAFTDVYASPEQRHGREIDNRTDLYSLGLLLFELLTNEIPVGSDVDPSAFNPNLQRNYVSFFTKVLKSRPEDRYQNAEEMEKGLITVAKAESKYGKGKIVYHTYNDLYVVSFDEKDNPVVKKVYSAKNRSISTIAVSPNGKKILIAEKECNTYEGRKYHEFIVKSFAGEQEQLFGKLLDNLELMVWNADGIHVFCAERDIWSKSWFKWDMTKKELSLAPCQQYSPIKSSPNGKYNLYHEHGKLYAVSADNNFDMRLIVEQNYVCNYVWISDEAPIAKESKPQEAKTPLEITQPKWYERLMFWK